MRVEFVVNIISREEARERGLKRFFTGESCDKGHVCERYTSVRNCVECNKARYNTWRKENLSQDIERKKEYYLKTSATQIASARKWMNENPERVRVIQAKTHSKRRGAEGEFFKKDIDELYKTQSALCAEPTCMVSISEGFHIDHIMPIKLGGTNWPSNLQLLCAPCNVAKNAKHPDEWAKVRGRK